VTPLDPLVHKNTSISIGTSPHDDCFQNFKGIRRHYKCILDLLLQLKLENAFFLFFLTVMFIGGWRWGGFGHTCGCN
jgi:hypothetical protein